MGGITYHVNLALRFGSPCIEMAAPEEKQNLLVELSHKVVHSAIWTAFFIIVVEVTLRFLLLA